MMTHEQYLTTKRFPALDGVRAIAAVLVVVFHYGGPTLIRANGWIGVHLFFVMSGFLITTLALREEDRNGRASLANFYIRRAFRILPVYYVILAMIVVFIYLRGALHTSGIIGALPWNLTFMGEFHQMTMFGQAWTLGVEQKFYVLWPLLAFAIAGLGFVKRLSLALGLVTMLIVLVTMIPYASAFASIVVGCALAIALHYRKGFAALRVFTHPAVGIVIAVLLVAVQMYVFEIGEFLNDEGNVYTVLGYVVLAALLVPSLVAGGSPLTWVLSRAPMRWIGERSYALYLVQQLVAAVVAAALPQFGPHRALTAVAVTIAGLLVADVLYRWVELPMIELGRRIIARRAQRRASRETTPEAAALRPAPAPVG